MRDVVMNGQGTTGEGKFAFGNPIPVVGFAAHGRPQVQTEKIFPGRITTALARKLCIPWDELIAKTTTAREKFGERGASAFIEAYLLNVHLGRRAFGLRSGDEPGLHVWPIIKGYHGDMPFSEAELWKQPWRRAESIGVALRTSEVMLDIDHKDGAKAGWDHLIELEEHLGSLPPTARYGTRTGGAHLLFGLPRSGSEDQLSAKLARLNGTGSHIDILRATHRYAVVHDFEFWCQLDPSTVSELPGAWMNWATMELQPSACERPISPLSTSLAALADTVQQASEGERNTILSLCAFRAFCLGYTFDQDLDALREAALLAGLEPGEIEATLMSAREKAWVEWQPVGKWIASVEQELETVSSSKSIRLRALALAFTSHFLLLGRKEWIGMSVRQAEEILGVSHATTAKYLRWFVDRGLLTARRPRARLHAMEYRIPLKNVDTRFEEHEGVSTIFQPFGIRSVPGGNEALLLGHEAFQRMGGSLEALPTLPPSAASVLVALENGASTIRDLTTRSSFHERTIRSTIEKLDSACLVEICGDFVKASYSGDSEIGLSAWSRSKGLGQRLTFRRERIKIQRSGFKEHDSKLQLLRRHGVQLTAGTPSRGMPEDGRKRPSILETRTSGIGALDERKSLRV